MLQATQGLLVLYRDTGYLRPLPSNTQTMHRCSEISAKCPFIRMIASSFFPRNCTCGPWLASILLLGARTILETHKCSKPKKCIGWFKLCFLATHFDFCSVTKSIFLLLENLIISFHSKLFPSPGVRTSFTHVHSYTKLCAFYRIYNFYFNCHLL